MPWLMDSADGKAGEKGCISPRCGDETATYPDEAYCLSRVTVFWKSGGRAGMQLNALTASCSNGSKSLHYDFHIRAKRRNSSKSFKISVSLCIPLTCRPISPRRMADRPVSSSLTPATARKSRFSLADAIWMRRARGRRAGWSWRWCSGGWTGNRCCPP